MVRIGRLTEALRSGLADGDRSGPLYRQIASIIADLIRAGLLPADDALPAERELAGALGLGRVTVASAYKDLMAAGLVERRQGSGTFVVDRLGRISEPLWKLSSFSSDMVERGKVPGTKVLDLATGTPSAEEAFHLGLGPNRQVLRLHRLRLADGKALALEKAVIPTDFLSMEDVDGGSLYAALDRRGHRPVHAMQRLTAVTLDAQTAAVLDVAAGAPALRIERVAHLADGRCVEFTRSFYRGDSYDFFAELRQGGQP